MKLKLFFLLAFLASTSFVSAVTFIVDGINYNTISDTEVEVIVLDSGEYSGDITLPAIVTYNGNDYSLIKIGNSAFEGSENLISVLLPNSIQTIGRFSFNECTKLISINLPDGLKTLDLGAFDGCSNLKSAILPNSLEVLAGLVYRNCISLTSISIPQKITVIHNGAFKGCANLKNIIFPETLTEIDRHAFSDCHFETLNFPEGLTLIHDTAFKGCANLKSVSFPKSFEGINYYAFEECPNLFNIILRSEEPPYLDSRDTHNTFSTSIYDTAVLTVPQTSVNKYKNHYGWKFFKNIVGDGISFVIDGIEYSVINDTEVEVLGFSNGDSTNTYVELPEKVINDNKEYLVTNIAVYAFKNSQNLKSVILSDNITSVGKYSFSECTNLENISLSENLTIIYDNAFDGCSALKSIVLPSKLEGIASEAFKGCGNLVDIKVKTETPFYFYSDVFSVFQTRLLGVVTVPQKSLGAYQRSSWGDNFNNLVGDGVPPFINNGIEYNVISESEVEVFGIDDEIGVSAKTDIPDKVTNNNIEYAVARVDAHAFEGAVGLENVTLPSKLKIIGENAFKDCTDLIDIKLPDSITIIDEGTFSGCISLLSVDIPDNVTIIDSGAFSRCESLVNVNFPNKLTHVNNYAFTACLSIRDLSFPDSLTYIGIRAFASCESLVKLVLPKGVSIARASFANCQKLSNIELSVDFKIVVGFGSDSVGAFFSNKAINLVKVSDVVPVELSEWEPINPFYRTSINTATLIVPDGSKTAYENATVWKDFGTIVEESSLSTTELNFQENFGLEISQDIIQVIAKMGDAVEEVELLDMNGRIIKTVQGNELPISEISSGMYILKVKTDGGVFVKKFAK